MPLPSPPLRHALPRRQLLASLSAGLGAGWVLDARASCQPVRIPLAPGGLLVREESGQARGVLVDLIAALQQRLNCEVVSELLPQGRLVRAFYDTFEADVLIPGSPVTYEGHTPHFVPLFRVQANLVTRDHRSWRAAQAMALLDRGGRCVLPRHVTYGADFDALVRRLEAEGRVTWVRDVGTALRMVDAQRVDFTLLSPLVTYSYVGETQYRRFRMLALSVLRPMETGAAVSRRSLPDEVQGQVVAALQAMVRDGEVGRAFALHFPPDVLAQEPLALLRR